MRSLFPTTRTAVVASTVAINAMFVATILRQCTIVHGDGPGGFGEVLVKGMLAQISLAAFICVLVSARSTLKNRDRKRGVPWVSLLATATLAAIFILCLQDACSDQAGYCRSWRVELPPRSP